MSGRELTRVEVLSRVKAGTLSLRSAATLLAVSYRHAKRLVRRYRAEGAKGLKHRRAGGASNHARPAAERARVLALVREKYSGPIDVRFGPTLTAEHLASEDGITVHHDTLRRWMLAAGLWSRARTRAPHRARRERKAHFGELVQLDGSFHLWYEARGCLMNLVDDATGRTLARLGAQETIWAAVDVPRPAARPAAMAVSGRRHPSGDHPWRRGYEERQARASLHGRG
jgi:transposase